MVENICADYSGNNSLVLNKICEISKNNVVKNRKVHHRHLRNCIKQRVVSKGGQFNIVKWGKGQHYMSADLVTAFIEARWRWTLIYCILTYLSVWLAFTLVWWVILYIHGDLHEENLPQAVNSTIKPCVREIYGFTSLFLFSVEVQTTVGYGNRALTLECPAAIVTMCMESILGTIMHSFMVGVLFAKLTRPKNRAQTLLFSKNAIINQRNRSLCLMFRVGNTRKSRIISVSVRAYLIRFVTSQGDMLKNGQIQLSLNVDDGDEILFLFPICVVHEINVFSPFHSMSANEIINAEMEVLVVLEGIIESTGQPVQAKSSYIGQEILWGRRFVPLVSFPKDKGGYVVDYAKFDEVQRVNTPLCAAKGLKNFYNNIIKR